MRHTVAKKILVAGAGHGGLIAAALLSKNGYDVTVLERGKKGSVGHDWPVSFDISVLGELNLTLPQSIRLSHCNNMTYVNPRKTIQLTPLIDMPDRFRIEDRELMDVLILNAEKFGAKIIYEVDITGPEVQGNRVVGVSAVKDGENVKYFADLVIDSAGCESPVRSNLPAEMGIEREFCDGQMFYAYRALYERKGKMQPPNAYCLYFFHMNCKGIDSVMTEDDYVDVMIGRFQPADSREINAMLSDLKIDNPHLGKNILRGGETAIIPIRRTLPVFVADGYAAVGDCAGMTNPVFGWGINCALLAGKILAQTVTENKKGDFTVKSLWNYQKKYFYELGSRLAALDKLRQFYYDSEIGDINFLFEKNIISGYELESSADSEFAHIPVLELLGKAIVCSARLPLLIKIIKTARGIKKLEAVSNQIPEKYDRKKVMKWANKYLNT